MKCRSSIQGIVAEHQWTRTNAGLFDVSHMGQAFLAGRDHMTVAAALEQLVPGDIAGLEPGRIRYTQFIDPDGGIIDDLMVTRPEREGGRLILVVNASRKAIDYAWLRENLPPEIAVERARRPGAARAAGSEGRRSDGAAISAEAAGLGFMTATGSRLDGMAAQVSRSGYTGEDGFEISLAAGDAAALFDRLLGDEPRCKPVGLGARDSLRLEAGLCLYGHDIDETHEPGRGRSVWSIPARRRRSARLHRREPDRAGAGRGRVAAGASASRREGRAPARRRLRDHAMTKRR